MTVRDLHHAAMRKALAGDRMARRGNLAGARGWYRFAARQETMAFELLPAAPASEPTRAILGLSAASLWRQAGKHIRAIIVIRAALPTATLLAEPVWHRELVALLRKCEVEYQARCKRQEDLAA